MHGNYGTAEWMQGDEAHALGLFGPEGVLIGTGSNGFVRYNGDGHTLMIAPPGSGKGVGFVVPNCVAYPGSLLVIDPKGENAAVTARRRREMGQDVFVLDPFGVSRQKSASFNPLAWLQKSEPQHFMADLAAIAEALIVPETSDAGAHFYQQAVNMVEGIILDVFEQEPEGRATLMRVFERAFADEKTFFAMFDRMSRSEYNNPKHPRLRSRIQASGNWYFSISDKDRENTRSTLQKNLRFLKNYVMEDVTERSDFDIRDFKHGGMTIYLCLPFEYLEMHKAWLRLMLTMAVLATLRVGGRPAHPVLFLCDEFYAGIGRLDLIARAVPSIRGAGGRFAFIMQSLAQLKSMYPQVWEDFFAGSGAAIFCNINDRETADYLSARLGTMTQTIGGGVPQGGVFMNTAGRPLMTLDEVTRHPKTMEIVLLQNNKPLRCGRINCVEDQRFNGLLDPNPMHL